MKMETFKEYVQKNFNKDIDKDTLTDKQKVFFRLDYEEYSLVTGKFEAKTVKKCISQKGKPMYVLDLFEPKSGIEVRYYILEYLVKDFFCYNRLDLANWTEEEILKRLKSAEYRICSYKRWHNRWIASNIEVSCWIKDIWSL